MSPLFSAMKYCATGSALPAAWVCLRASSTALVNSGNHGIATPMIPGRPDGFPSAAILCPLAPYLSPAPAR